MTIQTVEPTKPLISPTVMPSGYTEIQPLPTLPRERDQSHDSDNGTGNGKHPAPTTWNGKHSTKTGRIATSISKADINYDDIITEDDEPVDNFASEKQQRLLVQPLFDNNYLPEPFVAAVDVGIFLVDEDPVVPDMFLSLGVGLAKELWEKQNRSYFLEKFGKPPEIAVEIVSNKKGRETAEKLQKYAQIGVKYYVIFDFQKNTQDAILRVYELQDKAYIARPDYRLPDLGLSLVFWDGTFEKMEQKWLRWCKLDGEMLLTGKEDSAIQRVAKEDALAVAEQERIAKEEAEAAAEQERIAKEEAEAAAEQERIAKEQERAAKEQAELEIERLRAKLRALGLDDD
ncbi:MAG: Uma2 family endonuclease [Chloroflexota bacterium]